MATSNTEDYDRSAHPDAPDTDGDWVDENFLAGPGGYDY